MNESAELRELMLRSYAAIASGDTTFYDSILSTEAGVLIIGTDPNEWWADRETIDRVFKAQIREMGGIAIVGSDPLAYSLGDAGWVADRPKFKLPDGTEIPIRTSAVFAKQQGEWKLVHQHISIGVPNESVVGQELTLS